MKAYYLDHVWVIGTTKKILKKKRLLHPDAWKAPTMEEVCVTGWWADGKPNLSIGAFANRTEAALQGYKPRVKRHRKLSDTVDCFMEGADLYFVIKTNGCPGRRSALVVEAIRLAQEAGILLDKSKAGTHAATLQRIRYYLPIFRVRKGEFAYYPPAGIISDTFYLALRKVIETETPKNWIIREGTLYYNSPEKHGSVVAIYYARSCDILPDRLKIEVREKQAQLKNKHGYEGQEKSPYRNPKNIGTFEAMAEVFGEHIRKLFAAVQTEVPKEFGAMMTEAGANKVRELLEMAHRPRFDSFALAPRNDESLPPPMPTPGDQDPSEKPIRLSLAAMRLEGLRRDGKLDAPIAQRIYT